MQLKILTQGYEATSELSVGKQLIKFFADEHFHTFIGLSAFLSQSGINGLAKHIQPAKKHLKRITIITGIDQQGTPKEALEALLELKIHAYIFYQPATTIFHPKIYLFEGKNKSELIIGSSNLTSQGLFTNIETSVLISIDNELEADRQIITNLKEYFNGIFNTTDPNLEKLSKKLISQLVKADLVPTEAERKAAEEKTKKVKKKVKEAISKIFPPRTNPKIPIEFRTRSKGKTKKVFENTKLDFGTTTEESSPIWESGPLTERDLNIPKGSNTNPTGSMLFKKGKMADIDQRHYFRDIVFSSLEWKKDSKPNSSHLERAKAIFNIIIDNTNQGSYELVITHNSKTDSASYKQKNSMTSISWGSAKKIIAKEELIGKSATLYKDQKDLFTIVIK